MKNIYANLAKHQDYLSRKLRWSSDIQIYFSYYISKINKKEKNWEKYYCITYIERFQGIFFNIHIFEIIIEVGRLTWAFIYEQKIVYYISELSQVERNIKYLPKKPSAVKSSPQMVVDQKMLRPKWWQIKKLVRPTYSLLFVWLQN